LREGGPEKERGGQQEAFADFDIHGISPWESLVRRCATSGKLGYLRAGRRSCEM
jgi:hypothetical protein